MKRTRAGKSVYFGNDSYQLVDTVNDDHRCLRQFDCAYDAAEALRRGLSARGTAAQSWRVLGIDGEVLFRPDDLEMEPSEAA